jgi:hypothetical protein
MDDLDRARRIRDKLSALCARAPETFGANGHGWQLAPPLDETALSVVEARLGAAIPPALRAFLGEVASGGAGPYYGILPPERWGEHRGDGEPELHARAISIADMGCANYVLLVVTGEARGRVVYASLEGGKPFFPENTDFLDWYERWCDELAWGYDHNWFGMQMPGDEATLAAVAADGELPRRAAALAALYQVPTFGDAARAAVLARLHDRDVKVRVAALQLAASRALLD